MKPIEFTAIGDGTQIGANCYRLRIGEYDIVIDCGLHPKREGLDATPRWDLFDRPPTAILLSHAHIDHCGTVPYLMKMFPEIPCYTTKPTVRIMDRMLHNSVHVMTIAAKERGVAGYPLFRHSDVEEAMKRVVGFEYGRRFQMNATCPITVEFRPAGHVLGSASIILRTDDHTICYTGDICANDQALLPAFEPFDKSMGIDSLIIESTRGAHVDDYPVTYEGEIERFSNAVASVVKGGGVALVPVFALGRMQELLNIIHRKQEAGVIPDCPVYSSGLGRAVYEVYSRYENYLLPGADLVPLAQFEPVGDVWEPEQRRKLLREPCIIAATSGMMIENTPSAMIAMDMIKEERHGIFFVGYLDPDTLGYKLLHSNIGDAFFFSNTGEASERKLENIQRFHFSAHAPREDLINVVKSVEPSNLIFVHGDDEAVNWMRENTNGTSRKFTPAKGETVALDR